MAAWAVRVVQKGSSEEKLQTRTKHTNITENRHEQLKGITFAIKNTGDGRSRFLKFASPVCRLLFSHITFPNTSTKPGALSYIPYMCSICTVCHFTICNFVIHNGKQMLLWDGEFTEIKIFFSEKDTKCKTYETLIKPGVLYDSESWTLTEVNEDKLKTSKEYLWRMRYNYELYKLFKEANIVQAIKINRVKWLGHVRRIEENSLCKELTFS